MAAIMRPRLCAGAAVQAPRRPTALFDHCQQKLNERPQRAVCRCPVKDSKVAEREPSDFRMHLQNGLPVDHMAPVAPKANAPIADNGCKCAYEGIHNDVEAE